MCNYKYKRKKNRFFVLRTDYWYRCCIFVELFFHSVLFFKEPLFLQHFVYYLPMDPAFQKLLRNGGELLRKIFINYARQFGSLLLRSLLDTFNFQDISSRYTHSFKNNRKFTSTVFILSTIFNIYFCNYFVYQQIIRNTLFISGPVQNKIIQYIAGPLSRIRM